MRSLLGVNFTLIYGQSIRLMVNFCSMNCQSWPDYIYSRLTRFLHLCSGGIFVKPRGSKDARPINLDISSIRLPITAWASISHRVTGVAMFAASVLLIWALDASLASEQSFNQLVSTLTSTAIKPVVWLVLVVFSYHSLAGIRHLIMDMGVGEDFKGGVLGARIVFVMSLVAAVLWGVALW